MALVLNGDGAIAGLTAGGLPDASITQSDLAAGVVGNGPAFSAHGSTTVSISAATAAKVAMNVEIFDTNNNYDTSNFRFTPTVAGYYQFSAGVNILNGGSAVFMGVYKNGIQSLISGYFTSSGTGTIPTSGLLYLNGSTDYAEVWVYSGSNNSVFGRSDLTYFTGFLARAA
jgi:hypothetical protein